MHLEQLFLKLSIILFEMLYVLSIILGLICHFFHFELKLLNPLHFSFQLFDIIFTFTHFFLKSFELHISTNQSFLKFFNYIKKFFLSFVHFLLRNKTLTKFSWFETILFFLQFYQILKLIISWLQRCELFLKSNFLNRRCMMSFFLQYHLICFL